MPALSLTDAPPADAQTSANAARPAPVRSAWPTVGALAWREWTRFIRQPNRVIGAVGQPVLFWILFGAGLGPSFRLSGVPTATRAAEGSAALTYAEYYFPGTLVLILLFTAIFATISIIEDRREGFLQSVLVAPPPRWAMVLGKLLGGTLIAAAQAGLFLLLAWIGSAAGWIAGVPLNPLTVMLTLGMLFVIGLALTALGFTLAWQLDSTQGFHAVMSVFLLPMWLLSGAFFPPGDNWVGWLVRLNPLTYCVAGVRRVLYWGADEATRAAALPVDLPGAGWCAAITVLFLAATLGAAWWSAGRRTAGDLL